MDDYPCDHCGTVRGEIVRTAHRYNYHNDDHDRWCRWSHVVAAVCDRSCPAGCSAARVEEAQVDENGNWAR